MNPAPRAYVLIGAVALAASLPSLRNGFVYDDVAAVQTDARIRSLAHPASLLALPYWNDAIRDRIYRPLTTASFAVDWAAGDGGAFPFHAVNLLLHVAVCLLVYRLARRVLGGGPGAFVAGLWFAVHPVHVEVFAGIVGRSELIAALGYLAAVLAYAAEAREVALARAGRRRAVLACLVLVAAAVAVGGKEHALTLPAGLLLADAWVAHVAATRVRDVFRRHALTWLAVLAIGAGFLAARAAVVGTAVGGGSIGAGLDHLTMAGRAIVMLPAMLVWLRVLLVPARLSADYSPNAFVPDPSLGIAHVAALVLIGALLAVAWRTRREIPGVAAGLAWFVVTASVAMNILVPTGVLLAERVLYLPSAGIALMVGAAWERLYVRAWPRFQAAAWTMTAAVLVLFAARSLARIPVWHDGERFYSALIADAPDSYRAEWARGARAFEAQQPREGESHYRAAIRAWPFDPAVPQELGERYLAAGLFAPANQMLTMAWRLDSTRADAAIQAVLARLRAGQPDSAAALGDAALRVFPAAPTLLLATSEAWQALGQPVRALTLRRRVAYAMPDAWQGQHVAAEAAARADRCEEARWRANRAVALAPDSAVAARELRDRLNGSAPHCGLGES